MPPVGFEPTISAGERPYTYALDRAATGAGTFHLRLDNIFLQTRNQDVHKGRQDEKLCIGKWFTTGTEDRK